MLIFFDSCKLSTRSHHGKYKTKLTVLNETSIAHSVNIHIVLLFYKKKKKKLCTTIQQDEIKDEIINIVQYIER